MKDIELHATVTGGDITFHFTEDFKFDVYNRSINNDYTDLKVEFMLPRLSAEFLIELDDLGYKEKAMAAIADKLREDIYITI